MEHELYHAGQDRDSFGAPKFRKSTGLPVFILRGHDIEEFIGVVRRYGQMLHMFAHWLMLPTQGQRSRMSVSFMLAGHVSCALPSSDAASAWLHTQEAALHVGHFSHPMTPKSSDG
nr:putative metallopeptidase [Phyllobacterium sp. IY22]